MSDALEDSDNKSSENYPDGTLMIICKDGVERPFNETDESMWPDIEY